MRSSYIDLAHSRSQTPSSTRLSRRSRFGSEDAHLTTEHSIRREVASSRHMPTPRPCAARRRGCGGVLGDPTNSTVHPPSPRAAKPRITLIATDDLPCMHVLTTARAPPSRESRHRAPHSAGVPRYKFSDVRVVARSMVAPRARPACNRATSSSANRKSRVRWCV